MSNLTFSEIFIVTKDCAIEFPTFSELSDGHYYVSEPGLMVDKPLKFVGDENNRANVIVEVSGSIEWTGKGGWIEGITFRRPKIAGGLVPSTPMLHLVDRGKLNVIQSIFDNEPSTGATLVLSGSGNKGAWDGVTIRHGGSVGVRMSGQTELSLQNCTVKGNAVDGIVMCNQASIELKNCEVSKNKGYGVRFRKGSKGVIVRSHFASNRKGVLYKETGSSLSCSSNTAIVSALPGKQIPGFKLTLRGADNETVIPNQVLE
jgi:parallel beta-helix repeat protein